MTRADVVVAGAGIAGLACAAALARERADVVVVDAARRPGGAVESAWCNGFLVERGPSTVRATPELADLALWSGTTLIEGRVAAPALVSHGALLPLPPPLSALLRGRPLGPAALAGLLGEPFRPHPRGPRSVRDFVEQRLGPGAAELADLATLGIYGAPADRVGFESAFPALAADLAQHGSLLRRLLARLRASHGEPRPERRGLVSTATGLGLLVDNLARGLGERLLLDTPLLHAVPVSGGFELELGGPQPARLACRALVLALPPDQVARVLELPRAERLAARYRPSPQLLASFALEDPALAARWRRFGFLVPRRERLPLIGCLVPSAVFPGRAPDGSLLLTVFTAPELHAAPDAEIARTLAPLLRRLLGAAREPVLLDVRRHPQGIWLYDRRQRDRTRALRARLAAAPGLHVAGAAYDGVSLGAAAASGLAAAASALAAARAL